MSEAETIGMRKKEITKMNNNVNTQIATLAKRHGVSITSSAIDQFVAGAGVRELQASELKPVAGGLRPNPTPEQCTKFFTYPSTTWGF
jgi:hypothetical protein